MTMNPKARHVPAGEFKARCLALLDEVADTAVELGPSFPGDAGDRLIFATAVHHRAHLVTKDGQLRKWDRARTVW